MKKNFSANSCFTSLLLIVLSVYAVAIMSWKPIKGLFSNDVSDLVIDSCVAAESLQVLAFTIEPDDTFCFAEGNYFLGFNRILAVTTLVANLGPDDALFGLARPPYWYKDSCHNHWHADSFITFKILNCRNEVVMDAHKVGFALQDGPKYVWALTPNLPGNPPHPYIALDACQQQWLQQYGPLIDSSYAYREPNDAFNSINQGITANHYDEYGFSTEGNGLHIEGWPDGHYKFVIDIIPPPWINEGNNTGPNHIAIPFYLQGNTVLKGSAIPAMSAPDAPASVIAGANRVVSWNGDACRYKAERWLTKGNGSIRILDANFTIYANSFHDTEAPTSKEISDYIGQFYPQYSEGGWGCQYLVYAVNGIGYNDVVSQVGVSNIRKYK